MYGLVISPGMLLVWVPTRFPTLAGSEHFCISRSCLDTLRKQGRNMLCSRSWEINAASRVFTGGDTAMLGLKSR
ncbi:hypothetical protein F1735_24055 [Massilia sp. CCM 8694]|uniref:Secreted protein n=1 Tax=Massilia genomosp. 1 TaxID=2609280 RepID=A0ABX0MSE6_9BURK|nr:hypothetical protein [Massilia genomosp. 1]